MSAQSFKSPSSSYLWHSFSSQSLKFGSQSQSHIPRSPATGRTMMLFWFYSHLCTLQADQGTGQDLRWDEMQFALILHPPHSWWLCPRVSHVSDLPVSTDSSQALWVCVLLALGVLHFCVLDHCTVSWITLGGSLLVPRCFWLPMWASTCAFLGLQVLVSLFLQFLAYVSLTLCVPLCLWISESLALFLCFHLSGLLVSLLRLLQEQVWPGFRLPQNYQTCSVCFLLPGPWLHEKTLEAPPSVHCVTRDILWLCHHSGMPHLALLLSFVNVGI